MDRLEMTSFNVPASAIVAVCAVVLLYLILGRLFNFDIVATVPGPPSPSRIYGTSISLLKSCCAYTELGLSGNMIQLVLPANYGDDEFTWHKRYGPVYRIKGCFGVRQRQAPFDSKTTNCPAGRPPRGF
jgi:hypothetical protein